MEDNNLYSAGNGCTQKIARQGNLKWSSYYIALNGALL